MFDNARQLGPAGGRFLIGGTLLSLNFVVTIAFVMDNEHDSLIILKTRRSQHATSRANP